MADKIIIIQFAICLLSYIYFSDKQSSFTSQFWSLVYW